GRGVGAPRAQRRDGRQPPGRQRPPARTGSGGLGRPPPPRLRAAPTGVSRPPDPGRPASIRQAPARRDRRLRARAPSRQASAAVQAPLGRLTGRAPGSPVAVATGTLAVMDLAERILAGDRRAIAQAISMVEDGADGLAELSSELFAHTGRAYTVGVTGSPGVGKSTLAGALVAHARRLDLSVAVLAIDPTSPFTGGALLGDRLRMQEHATDPGVFIRSMATRGHLGGMALAAPEAIRILDAAGA